MSWQIGMIGVLLVAIFLPLVVAEMRNARRSRQVFRPDPVARKHRAIVRRGFKSRMGVNS